MNVNCLTIIGSTGSVGQASLKAYATLLDVSKDPPIQLFALIAEKNHELLWQQIVKYRPRYAILTDHHSADRLRAYLDEQTGSKIDTQILAGPDAAIWACQDGEVEIVIAAASGQGAFSALVAAIDAEKKILLANKESLIFGGAWLLKRIAQTAASIIPVDSEHNAIFQCLSSDLHPKVARGVNFCELGVEKVGLLATGGPFWNYSPEQLESVTPAMACQHPIWRMGKKISVDSATLMNKALEYLEMIYLFGLPEAAIEVQLHPAGRLHGWVQYCDGHRLLHYSAPDLSLGILYALHYPSRVPFLPAKVLAAPVSPETEHWEQMALHPLSKNRLPALRLASDAFRSGFWSPIILNTANEYAVQAFLEGRLSFSSILTFCERAIDVLNQVNWPSDSLKTRRRIDLTTRAYCAKVLNLNYT